MRNINADAHEGIMTYENDFCALQAVHNFPNECLTDFNAKSLYLLQRASMHIAYGVWYLCGHNFTIDLDFKRQENRDR